MVRGNQDTISKEQWDIAAFKSALDDADPNKQKAFIESIKSGNFINEANAGADSALTCIMGRTAAYTGREVTWEQMIRSNDRFDPKLDMTKFDKK